MYIPLSFFGPEVIASNLSILVPGASLYHFGILSSRMHMAWMRVVAGRLESRYRYSAELVYNNFPWPEVGEKRRKAIEAAAQAVLNTRVLFPASSLADLYDPKVMPKALLDAHKKLDHAVDRVYRVKSFVSDGERAIMLLERYSTAVAQEQQRPRKGLGKLRERP